MLSRKPRVTDTGRSAEAEELSTASLQLGCSQEVRAEEELEEVTLELHLEELERFYSPGHPGKLAVRKSSVMSQRNIDADFNAR